MSDSNKTIKFQSTRFGELEVDQDSVLEIVFGIIGFPDNKKFVLLDYNPPFSWLHSTENSELAFVVVSAAEFGDNYKVPIPRGDKDIDLQEDDDVAVFNLVTIRKETALSTVNLKAPVIVNLRNKKGRQIILDQANYSTRHLLWGEDS